MKRHQQCCGELVGFLLYTGPLATNHRVLVAIDAAVETFVLLNQLAVQDVVSKLVPYGKRASAIRLAAMVHDGPLPRPRLPIDQGANAARDVALDDLVD